MSDLVIQTNVGGRTHGLKRPLKVPGASVFKNWGTAWFWKAGRGNCKKTSVSTSGLMLVRHTRLLNPPPEKSTAVSGTWMVPPTAVTLRIALQRPVEENQTALTMGTTEGKGAGTAPRVPHFVSGLGGGRQRQAPFHPGRPARPGFTPCLL